jgi:uncharacterized protein (TIGR00299 family) protein
MSRRHIHLQALGGIAGDMFVAAMLDAFPELREQVLADIAAVLPPRVGVVRLERVLKNGISALHFSLDESLSGGTEGGTEYRPLRTASASFRPSLQALHCDAEGIVSDYAGIRRLIEGASLSATTARHAVAILDILAHAESRIHGVPLEQVHFHELAAWDSLMDVVAAGSVISAMGEATWSVASLPLGSGLVKTQHGPLPVPAPATLRVLEGYPWHSDNTPGERVTPTGAAIVRHLVPPERLTLKPSGTLRGEGYGAGTKNFTEIANVLRVVVFEVSGQVSASDGTRTRIVLAQFDVDDMTGEEVGIAAERLRQSSGVLDVVLIPAQGKKGRPVTMFQLLIDPACFDACCDLIFQETSTIGMRWSEMDRRVLPRQARLNADGLRVKDVCRPGGEVTSKLESDELEATPWLAHRRQIKLAAEGEPHE